MDLHFLGYLSWRLIRIGIKPSFKKLSDYDPFLLTRREARRGGIIVIAFICLEIFIIKSGGLQTYVPVHTLRRNLDRYQAKAKAFDYDIYSY